LLLLLMLLERKVTLMSLWQLWNGQGGKLMGTQAAHHSCCCCHPAGHVHCAWHSMTIERSCSLLHLQVAAGAGGCLLLLQGCAKLL
jgi:hypothetical protein